MFSDDSPHGRFIIRSTNYVKSSGEDSEAPKKRPLCPVELQNNTIRINYGLIGIECEVSTEDAQKLMETERRETEEERHNELISIIFFIFILFLMWVVYSCLFTHSSFIFRVIGIIFFYKTRRNFFYRSIRRERVRGARTLMQVSANTVIHKRQNKKTTFKEVQRREFPMRRVRTRVGSVIKSVHQKESGRKEIEFSSTALQEMTIQEDYSIPFLDESQLSEEAVDIQDDQFALEESSQLEQTSFTISEISHESCNPIFFYLLSYISLLALYSLSSLDDKVDEKKEKESDLK